MYAPEAFAVVVAVDAPLSVIVAPLPEVPTLPVMLQVDAWRLSEKVFATPAALAVKTAVWDVGTFAATVAENGALVAPAGYGDTRRYESRWNYCSTELRRIHL